MYEQNAETAIEMQTPQRESSKKLMRKMLSDLLAPPWGPIVKRWGRYTPPPVNGVVEEVAVPVTVAVIGEQ